MGSSEAGQQLLFLLLLTVAFLLLVVRPQRVRARALREVRAGLAPGRRVLTTAGLHATVAELYDDTVVLEIAPGVHARFATGAVVRLLDDPAEDAPGAAPSA